MWVDYRLLAFVALSGDCGDELRQRNGSWREVMIFSAQDLNNVKHMTKDEDIRAVYVEKGLHMEKSRVDEHGDVNPTWNEVVKVKSHEGLLENDVMAALNVDLQAHSHVREKPVGSERVLLLDILKGRDVAELADNQIQCLTVQVWRPSGMPMSRAEQKRG